MDNWNSYVHWITADPREYPLIKTQYYTLIDAMLNHRRYAPLNLIFRRLMDAFGEAWIERQ